MTMRKNIIALSLFEAAKLIHEQEMPAPATEPTGAPASAPTPTDTETGEPIDLDAVVERLNIIRSGKSFGDPEVYGKLTTMFKAMPEEEKIKLYTQLKGIGAIVQSQMPPKAGEQALPPAPEMATPEAAPPAAPAAPPAAPPAV